MFLRRSAAALAATTVLCAAAAPLAAAAPAVPAAPAADDGLYGTGDPQYDGVWRQSVALLAQDTAGVTPAKNAVDWLAGQQCADGSFAAYRPDPERKCGKKTVADSNATAAAVQALAAVGGHGDAVRKSVDWLKSVQNEDGGWSYNPGGPSDTNSVSVVIGALAAAGTDPAKTVAGKKDASPYHALIGFQLGCDAERDERGAFAYQPDKKGALAPNADATAAAALAALGEGMAVQPPAEKDGKRDGDVAATQPPCSSESVPADRELRRKAAAQAGAAYLARELKRNGGHLMSALPGAEDRPDHGNTADAVIALAAGGHGAPARTALGWLEKHVGDWDKAKADPAALGQLVLAAHAAGGDPRDFGGVDVVKRLNATGPEPRAVTAEKEDADDGAGEEDGDDDSPVTVISLIGAGLAAGIGVGILLSGRRKRQAL